LRYGVEGSLPDPGVAAPDDEVEISPPVKVTMTRALTRRPTDPRVNWELLAFVRFAYVPTGDCVECMSPLVHQPP
jgi:hypothetical protein